MTAPIKENTEALSALLKEAQALPGAGSGGMPYEIGYGLNVENNTLSAEVGKSSFIEIPNTKVQEIFKKVMEG